MGVVLNCGAEKLYISSKNWSDFKNSVLFETLLIIGGIYPNLFLFIDEKYEIIKRTHFGKQINNSEGVFDTTVSLKNICEDKLGFFPEIYMDYVTQNYINVNHMNLIGVYDLFYNNLQYSFENSRKISISLVLLKTYTTLSHVKTTFFNQLIDIFDYSWENKKDVVIL
jgi:hypothetical protein